MKKPFLLIVFTCLSVVAFSQQITKITLSGHGDLENILVTISDGVVVNVTSDGNLGTYGLEPFNRNTQSYGDFTDRLDPYQGRVDYFTANDNVAFRGKVRYIGKTPITYYASFDDSTLAGKIRTIGTSVLTYYMNFEDKAFRGKLKKFGGTEFNYFSSFDNPAFRGKLRAVGITNIVYFASFDDKAFAGKIKSIGTMNFSYYSSFDRPEFAGQRKSGQPIQFINGIKYFLKN